MKKFNVNIHPHKGYRFKDVDGATVVGPTLAGVIQRVKARRARNGFPPGDPDKEVTDQLCVAEPGACAETTDAAEILRQSRLKIVSLKSRVLQWLNKLKLPIDHFVSPEESRRRADLCNGCPQAQGLPEGCSSCRKAAEELRNAVLAGRPADGRLVHRGCQIFSADVATQVWLEIPAEDRADAPGNCWRKRTL